MNSLQELPEEVKDIVFSSTLTNINREIEKKFSLSFKQIDYIVSIQKPLFSSEIRRYRKC